MSRRVLVAKRGGPSVLEVRSQDLPNPGSGQVRIRVHRAGVAYGDVMRRKGVLAPPWSFTPGYDVVGVVDGLGSGVQDVQVGARVASMMPGPGFGGYADHVCVKTARLVSIPDEVTDDTAIALGLNYITARQLIHRFVDLKPGQSALVHGAAGGVGTALLDLGHRHGLTLYGTASKGKHDHLRARDCIPIDYRSEDFVARIADLTEAGVDAVFDGIGGAHLAQSYQTLGEGGTLVSFGISGDVEKGLIGVAVGVSTFARLKLKMDGKRVCMYNITASKGTSPAHCRDDWQHLLGMAARGELAPVIGAVVPLDEVAKAHDLMDRAAVRGKVILSCD